MSQLNRAIKMSLPIIIGNEDYKDEAVLRYVLSRFLPGSFGEDAADMSGMDCFVAVIRHICSVTDRSLMELVASSDALKFVMADFSAETEEKRNKIQEFKVATLGKIEKLVGKKKPTFEDIVECEAVRKGFWTHHGLILFQPLLYRDELDQRWHCKEDDSMSEATHSLVEWPLQTYTTIEDVLTQTKFGTRRSDGGQDVKFTFGRPAVVRVRLASKVDRQTWQGNNFSIRDVQCFSYDTVTLKTSWNPAQGKTNVKQTTSHRPKDRLVYCLIAVVRLRNPGEHHDYARLYDIDSQNVLPHGDQKYLGTFDSDSWSVGHLDHDHMLYYARADGMSVDCVRRYMEVGDQDPDPDCVRRDERLLEAFWQETAAKEQPPEPELSFHDDFSGDRAPSKMNTPFK